MVFRDSHPPETTSGVQFILFFSDSQNNMCSVNRCHTPFQRFAQINPMDGHFEAGTLKRGKLGILLVVGLTSNHAGMYNDLT